MYRFILIIIFLLFSGVLFFSCCHKDPVSITDVRKLIWSVDTLAHPDNWQTSAVDIWASSATNVYVVGKSNTTHGILWQFNGRNWSDIKISVTEGGQIVGSIGFDDIYGFGPYDVWVAGYRVHQNPNPPPNFFHSSLLIHYDGTEWKEIPTPDGHYLTAIWGPSPDNIWIAGVNGTLFHYDGTEVKKDTIYLDIPKDADPVYNVLSLTGNDSEAYMLIADFNTIPNRYFFLEYLENKWIVQDSTFFFDSSSLWMSPSGTLYATGRAVYRRDGNTWTTVLDGSSSGSTFDIHGTSAENLFVVGKSQTGDGAVYHYNGRDWFSYVNLENPDYVYYRVWTDGAEVFITGRAYPESIVLHGR